MSDKCEIAVASVQLVVESDPKGVHKNILLSWNNQDEDLGSYVLGLLQNMGWIRRLGTTVHSCI